jgi:hypothetical protein
MLTQNNTNKMKSPYLSKLSSSSSSSLLLVEKEEQQQQQVSHKRYEIIEEIINTEIIQNKRSILVDSSANIQSKDILIVNLNKKCQTNDFNNKLTNTIQIEKLHNSTKPIKTFKSSSNCSLNLWNKYNLNEAIHQAYKEKQSNYLNLLAKLNNNNNNIKTNRVHSCKLNNNTKPKWIPAGGYNYSWTREALNKSKNNYLIDNNTINRQQQ